MLNLFSGTWVLAVQLECSSCIEPCIEDNFFFFFLCIVFFLFKLYPLLWGFCIVAHLKTKSVIYNFNSRRFIPSVFPSFYFFIYFISSHAHVCPHLLAEFIKEQPDRKWYLYCTIYQLCCFLIQPLIVKHLNKIIKPPFNLF